ncbi:His/Gly/Thr/Pro-type tRNA ligase C-terminal domain-containing protein [Tenuifilum sp.]|uniref:His/Gly/Thr/Pro-type tRNA ligase C-terminal domain-containing protein n=1 Tax=Tenuifilum sp. TaxID=2760880 RepID=UPI00403E846A
MPYLLIVGEKEQEANLVAVRVQGEGDKGQMKLEEFVNHIKAEIDNQLKEI